MTTTDQHLATNKTNKQTNILLGGGQPSSILSLSALFREVCLCLLLFPYLTHPIFPGVIYLYGGSLIRSAHRQISHMICRCHSSGAWMQTKQHMEDNKNKLKTSCLSLSMTDCSLPFYPLTSLSTSLDPALVVVNPYHLFYPLPVVSLMPYISYRGRLTLMKKASVSSLEGAAPVI